MVLTRRMNTVIDRFTGKYLIKKSTSNDVDFFYSKNAQNE
jgi:hypothetical protein